MSLKRKRNDLALSDKFRVVELLDQGKTQTEIAKSLDCSQAQISRISRSRAEIRAEYESNTNPDRKRHRTGKAPDVENALNVWFADARARDIPINGSILAEKSEALAKLMKKDDFKATDGWLSRWKKRQNIGFKRLHGESKDADTTAADNWVSNVLPGLLRDYDANDIYNADETALYFRALPDGTLAFKSESSGGSKKSKERVTVLVATNMTGTDRRKLLVIGKSREPRCFRGRKSLPVTYQSSGNAWMTSDIFRRWLQALNRDMARQRRNILLLVDNCSAHPKDAADKLSHVKLEFLPPNTTSLIQPCDQGIIKNMKGHYRRQVVRKIIADIDKTTLTANELARQLTLLDAVHLLSKAWCSVKTTTIANCFRHAGFALSDDASLDDAAEPDDVQPPEGIDSETFDAYVTHDDDLECTAAPTDEEICATLLDDDSRRCDDAEIDSDDDDFVLPTAPVCYSERTDAMATIRRFLEENRCDDFSAFYQLEDLITRTADSAKHQSKITQFVQWIP